MLLPATAARFGRASKPRSHWLYLSDLCDSEQRAAIQNKAPPKLGGAMLVELRIGAGDKAAQTLFPPSLHPSGEAVQWASDELPARIPGAELKLAVARIAAGALLVRHYPGEGSRHEAALVLGGALARAQWNCDEIAGWVEAVARTAADFDPRERARTAAGAVDKLNGGDNVAGIPRLREVWGKDVADTVARWLNIRAGDKAQAVGEDALALLFAEQHDGHFVFDHTRGEWFRWDDQVWRRDADEYVLDCTRALIRSHKLGRIRTATSIERAARTDRRLARDHTAWNADPMLLGTPGDVVDLRDGELLAPDAAYMVNLSAGVRPAPQGAPHPLWSQFLKEATCNDADLQRYLKQRAGYWLTGDTSLEDFDFFYGPGGNGKGVFLKTIASIMGDYALVAPISQFMVSRHDEHLCELARLAHARLVIASEPEENRSWAIGKIKQLTGNEGRIAARHMHQNFFEFLPRFKLVFVGNTKPRIASVDEALVRRLNLVPFQFRPATRDEQLKEKLVIEYPAILRWAIDGWLDLKANGRCRPAVIASATKEYLDDENVIAAWLAERCELGPAARGDAQGAVCRLENLVRGQRRGPGNQQEAQAPAGKAAGPQLLAATSTVFGSKASGLPVADERDERNERVSPFSLSRACA